MASPVVLLEEKCAPDMDATEFRIFNSVGNTTFLAGCLEPWILSTNKRAAAVPN